MSDEIYDEYKYLDTNLSVKRNEELKRFLKFHDNTNVLDFYDLEMYDLDIKHKGLSSLVNKAINKSFIDENITLTNEQREIIDILSQRSLFLSAPTSFGKTFIILEYIKRNESLLKNIIFIVPTLALMNELLKKIYKLFNDRFNICINGSEKLEEKNIFIFVPERSDNIFLEKIKFLEIDLLVMDEIYKLQGSKKELESDDRLILMNKIYLCLINKAKKVALLGPFIKDVKFEKSKLDIVKYYSNYSPVYNEIHYIDKEEWINFIDFNKSQLIYFHSPQKIYKNIGLLLEKYPTNLYYENLYKDEITYLNSYVNSGWYITQLLKRGIGVHHGKTPMFLRKFYETEFNAGNLKVLLCTNTLMEGINTPTDRMLVVDDPGGAFELNNLIGRVARLNPSKPVIGEVYICDKKLETKYKDVDSWRELTILAEKNDANCDEEILYFNTPTQNNNILKSYNTKKDYLINICNLNLNEITNRNLKLSTTYKFYQENYIKKFLTATNLQSCIKYAIKLTLKISQEWEIEQFDGISSKYKYLPYKYYVSDLLQGAKIGQLIREFNERYNINKNQDNINKFVDKIYNMDKAIRFKMSKMTDYLDMAKVDINSNINLKRFYFLLKKYNEAPIGIKILDDLGIESIDCKNILEALNYKDDDQISTSKMIKSINENQDRIINKLISPFSKSNVSNLFKK